MKFFNLDCHIAVIEDIKKIFNDLGHSVTSWCISGGNWVFNRQTPNTDIISAKNWRHIDQKMCDAFYERYKKELSEYDGFIVTYPPIFTMLFERFEKPIIVQVPIRYEVPFQNNPVAWNTFNEYLKRQIDNKIIIPVANSLYDKKYCEFFLQRDFHLIPNICSYTNTLWNPIYDKFLFSSRLNTSLNKYLVDKRTLGKYEWKTLTEYKGIVLVPYNCSIMSFFEHYTANIPMFVPDIDLMMILYKTYYNRGVLSELSWNQIDGLQSKSCIGSFKNDPNDYLNFINIKEWIKFSDFYNEEWSKHIIYFSSGQDLSEKLDKTNVSEVSKQMKQFNVVRKEKIYSEWRKILDELNNR